jgi:hypothetical protein
MGAGGLRQHVGYFARAVFRSSIANRCPYGIIVNVSAGPAYSAIQWLRSIFELPHMSDPPPGFRRWCIAPAGIRDHRLAGR